MNKALKVLVAIVGLFLLAACGEASVSTASTGDGESADRSTNELQARFEANPWEIVDREGFTTVLPDGVVTFEHFGADDIITLEILPCGGWGGHPIEWNEQGFILTDSLNTEGGLDTLPIECGPGDDLLDLLDRAVDPEQFFVEISDDGSTATVSRGERVLNLVPTTLEAERDAPPQTIVETTTSTIGS